VKDFKNLIAGYDYIYWSCSVARLDYTGTGVISRVCWLMLKTRFALHNFFFRCFGIAHRLVQSRS
jgi:hypothetical protein